MPYTWQLSWQADCNKGSIGTASHLGITNGRRNHFSLPCKDTISGTVGSFQSGGVFATGRALTIVNSPVCVCKVKVMNPQRMPSHYCLATYAITD